MLAKLLGDERGMRLFLDQHWLRAPFARAGAAADLVRLCPWERFEALVGCAGADVLVARDGERRDEALPLSPARARALVAQGHTLLVRKAERHDAELAELAASFQADFAAPVDVHAYATPAGRHGFGWHYDAEDVFILQTAGRKEFRLRRNTVQPWPVVESLPADMGYERETSPFFACTLVAGDWMYIPGGWWHVARAEEDSLSLAVGVLAPTALDVVDFLRPRLAASLAWRQRLPPLGRLSMLSAQELEGTLRLLLRDLGRELARTLDEEGLARAFLASRAARAGSAGAGSRRPDDPEAR